MKIIITRLLCVGVLPFLVACKEEAAPQYSPNDIAQNEAYAAQAAKMATQNALQTTTLPNITLPDGQSAIVQLPANAQPITTQPQR